MQAHQRTTVRGPTFIRLLARLTAVGTDAAGPSLPDRLARWLDWNHAIALSTALDGRPPPPPEGPVFDSREEEECALARAKLAAAIDGARELAPSGARGQARPAVADYAPFRQRYLTLQRAIQGTTGQLRGRLRDMLSAGPPAMARLAEVDAVMEMALSPREQKLLAAVPAVLADHFDRLRQSAHAAASTEGAAAAPDGWLDTFRNDMRSVLHAELDVRFQPVEGLLAALRTR